MLGGLWPLPEPLPPPLGGDPQGLLPPLKLSPFAMTLYIVILLLKTS